MENRRNRLYIKTVKSHDTETLFKHEDKSTITRFIFYGNFDCLALKNQTVTFKKSIYLDVCVLDFSKLHMYKTYCNILKPTLEDLELHYMDSDSFC